MRAVVKSTSTAKIKEQMGSASFQSGLNLEEL
jgi:hypothetical protein